MKKKETKPKATQVALRDLKVKQVENVKGGAKKIYGPNCARTR